METDKLITLIHIALAELANFVSESMFYSDNDSSIMETKKVLILLEKELKSNPANINERVLRAMHDLGMSTYKEFENSSVADALNNLTAVLWDEIPNYRNLRPLRNDFGKGNPI